VAQLEASALPQTALLTGGEGPTIEDEVMEPEEEEVISPEELAEDLEEIFYADVAREIPWYDGPEGVRNVLRAEGMAFRPGYTDELTQWLEDHASREANEQAEQQAFDWPEQELLPS